MSTSPYEEYGEKECTNDAQTIDLKNKFVSQNGGPSCSQLTKREALLTGGGTEYIYKRLDIQTIHTSLDHELEMRGLGKSS